MAEYRINDPRQGIIGPVRLQTAKDLISAGVIGHDVLISKDGGPWLPAPTYAELRGRTVAASEPRASFAGDLGKHSFFKVFYRFYLARAAGLLAVKEGQRHKEIYLEAGQPVFVRSNIESERLGHFLVRRGKIDADDLGVALQAMASNRNKLGMTLVRLGLLDQNDLMAELVQQQVHRLVDVCHWRTGQYQFFDGLRYSGERFDLKLQATGLMLHAARAIDEGRLAERLRPYVNSVPVRVAGADLENGAFDFTPVESQVLAAIDGRRTLGQIALELAKGAEARRAVFATVYFASEIDAVQFRGS